MSNLLQRKRTRLVDGQQDVSHLDNGNGAINDNGNGLSSRIENILEDHKKNIDLVEITFKNNEGEYVEFDDLAIADITVSKGAKKYTQATTFGLVVNGDNSLYEGPGELRDKHISIHGQRMVFILEKMFKEMQLQIKQIIVGHEHGKDKGKCHFQVVVELFMATSKTIKPFVIIDGQHRVYGTAQNAKNQFALKNYCKKEGDFYFLDNSSKIVMVYKRDKDGDPTNIVDVWATIYKNCHILDKEGALELALQHESRTVFSSFKNIEAACEKLTKPQLPEFKWNPLPDDIAQNYPLIKKWYETDCITDNDENGQPLLRRKALLLYSKERALGKTIFASNLVNHEDYCVIFRNNFNSKCIEGKEPKLLVLDDMTAYTENNKETWKALVASQPVSIRDAYLSMQWDYRIPCIITTNNLNLVLNMRASDDFKTQCYYVTIKEYMGPQGTRPSGLELVEDNFDEQMNSLLQEKIKQREIFAEQKRNEKKIFSVYGNNNEVNELKNIIDNLKVENSCLRNKYTNLNTDFEKLKNNPSKMAANEYNIELFNKKEADYEEKIRSLKCQLEMAINDVEAYQFTNNNLVNTNLVLFNSLETKKAENKDFKYEIERLNNQIDIINHNHQKELDENTERMQKIINKKEEDIIEEYKHKMRGSRAPTRGKS